MPFTTFVAGQQKHAAIVLLLLGCPPILVVVQLICTNVMDYSMQYIRSTRRQCCANCANEGVREGKETDVAMYI